MFNARRLALALQYVRDAYASPMNVNPDSKLDKRSFLVEPGTIISDNQETESDEYTDDDNVTLSFPDGTVMRIHIELVRPSRQSRNHLMQLAQRVAENVTQGTDKIGPEW